MVFITVVNGVYKPTCITGGHHFLGKLMTNHLGVPFLQTHPEWMMVPRRQSYKLYPYTRFTFFLFQWIGLRENFQESPIFNGKIYGFL